LIGCEVIRIRVGTIRPRDTISVGYGVSHSVPVVRAWPCRRSVVQLPLQTAHNSCFHPMSSSIPVKRCKLSISKAELARIILGLAFRCTYKINHALTLTTFPILANKSAETLINSENKLLTDIWPHWHSFMQYNWTFDNLSGVWQIVKVLKLIDWLINWLIDWLIVV